MKNLNKNFPNCPLNKKIREIYRIKQTINNSKLDDESKIQIMQACDNEIHRCWRLFYLNIKGYEILNDDFTEDLP